jgi:hypothetical protein
MEYQAKVSKDPNSHWREEERLLNLSLEPELNPELPIIPIFIHTMLSYFFIPRPTELRTSHQSQARITTYPFHAQLSSSWDIMRVTTDVIKYGQQGMSVRISIMIELLLSPSLKSKHHLQSLFRSMLSHI